MNAKRVRPILSGVREETTYLAVGMAEEGCWNLEAIANECRLKVYQVVYILDCFGIRLTDIRRARRTYVKRKMIKMIPALTGEIVREKASKIRYVRTRAK